MADKLTDAQIEQLAEEISVDVWTSIVLAHLGLKKPAIENLNKTHRGDVVAVSRELITRWRNKPSNKDNQVKTLAGILYTEAERYGKLDPTVVEEILEVNSKDAGTTTQSPSGGASAGGGGTVLTEKMVAKLAQEITDAAEVRNLGTMGLDVPSKVINKSLTDARDNITEAAQKVLQHWYDKQEDKAQAYKDLCKSLRNIDKAAFINVLK